MRRSEGGLNAKVGIPHTRLNGFGEAIVDQGVEKGDIENYMGVLGSRCWEIE